MTAPAAGGTGTVTIVITVVGVFGGLTGVGAFLTVLFQRKKFRADAAGVITSSALTLVEPLQSRVASLEGETATLRGKVRTAQRESDRARSDADKARRQAALANEELLEVRGALRQVTAMMTRWRAAILAPNATVPALRTLVTSDPGPVVDGDLT